MSRKSKQGKKAANVNQWKLPIEDLSEKDIK